MTHEQFKTLLQELDGAGINILAERNARYSSPDDALHNFHMGAEVMGGTPAQAAWGYMTKHLVALRDMIQRNDFSNRDDVLEKIQDSINYLRFIWAISEEERDKKNNEAVAVEDCEGYGDCVCCMYDENKPIDWPCNKCRNNHLPSESDYKQFPLMWVHKK